MSNEVEDIVEYTRKRRFSRIHADFDLDLHPTSKIFDSHVAYVEIFPWYKFGCNSCSGFCGIKKTNFEGTSLQRVVARKLCVVAEIC